MTVSSTTRKAGPYTGNGITTAFPFAFKVFAASEVRVVRTDLASVETDLTMGADYTVALNADQDANPGGTVTATTAPANGFLITVTSQLANLQAMTLTNQGAFYPKVINDALDRATIQIQQVAEQLSRAVKVAISSSTTPEQLVAQLNNNATAAAASAGSAAASAAASAAYLAAMAAIAQSFRNKIVNGNFDVWQRGTNFPAMANYDFCADRWQPMFDGTGVVIAASALNVVIPFNGFLKSTYALRYNCTANGTGASYRRLITKLEGVGTLQGKTVTFSARLAASTPLSVRIGFNQDFGTGGAPSVTVGAYSGYQTVSSTGIYSWTVTLPSIAGKTLGTNGNDCLWVIIDMPVGSTYYMDMGEIQLEEGSTATAFEQRPVAVETMLCQRYFWRTGGVVGAFYGSAANLSTNTAGVYFPHPVRMRAIPTVTVSAASDWYVRNYTNDTSYAATTIPAAVPTAEGTLVKMAIGTASLTAGGGASLVPAVSSATISFSSEL